MIIFHSIVVERERERERNRKKQKEEQKRNCLLGDYPEPVTARQGQAPKAGDRTGNSVQVPHVCVTDTQLLDSSALQAWGCH